MTLSRFFPHAVEQSSGVAVMARMGGSQVPWGRHRTRTRTTYLEFEPSHISRLIAIAIFPPGHETVRGLQLLHY